MTSIYTHRRKGSLSSWLYITFFVHSWLEALQKSIKQVSRSRRSSISKKNVKVSNSLEERFLPSFEPENGPEASSHSYSRKGISLGGSTRTRDFLTALAMESTKTYYFALRTYYLSSLFENVSAFTPMLLIGQYRAVGL